MLAVNQPLVKAFVPASSPASAPVCDCAASRGAALVPPYDHPDVIAGQGTIGLELLEQIPDLEAVVVPVGGGGLIAGIACAVKESKPGAYVIGVQSAAIPSMQVAMREHKPVLLPPGSTVADGIAVRKVGEKTLPMCEKYVDEILTVDDEEIAMAVLWLLEKEKTDLGSPYLGGVKVDRVVDDKSVIPRVYEPDHPEADKDGYVYRSNVNEVGEMVEMMAASRSYQNNVEVVNTARQLMMRTLDITKS